MSVSANACRRNQYQTIVVHTSLVLTGLVDLGFAFEVAAAVLGHEAGGKDVRILIRHYVRSDLVDRKREALEAWDIRLVQILRDEVRPATVSGPASHRELDVA